MRNPAFPENTGSPIEPRRRKTATAIAEYFRDMGYSVALMADSTSRWAQALREMSGRLEEIPGEEAFPAYLESYIAAFYERAGIVKLRDGSTGSVTIGGTVSPAGGNFEEPVTQATLKVVGAFHGLSRERSDARKYPAIDPIISWSKYKSVLPENWVAYARKVFLAGVEVNQMMKVVGEDGTTTEDYIEYLKSEFLDAVYMQQNSFDEIDAAVSVERQKYTFAKVLQVLGSDFELADKDTARNFFNQMRQKFIDWNYSLWNSDKFKDAEKAVEAHYESAKGKIRDDVSFMLKDGE